MRRWKVAWRSIAAVTLAATGMAAQTRVASAQAEVYSGKMPCADCSAIKTTLTLNKDAQGAPGSFSMVERFLGRPSAEVRKTSGTWTIAQGDAADKNATVYQLHPAGSATVQPFLKVDENTLRLLDINLKELPATLPHTLKRVEAATVVTETTGGEVTLKVGGLLEVRLAANHTTGYSWVAAPVANPVLARQGAAVYKQAAASGKVGVGGIEVWSFKAVKAGKESLRFEYRRPWEKSAAAAKTATFAVTVE
jgi:predicted secreted protein